MKILTVSIFTLVVSLNLFAQIYKDPNANIEDRISDLISKMTMDEKIGQMQQSAIYDFNEEILESVKSGKVGSFLNAGNLETKAKIQETAVKDSRLGIPIIFGRDVIHGFKTMFPIPLGQSATWNPELVKKGAEIAAIEAAEDGIHWTFAPMIDISSCLFIHI